MKYIILLYLKLCWIVTFVPASAFANSENATTEVTIFIISDDTSPSLGSKFGIQSINSENILYAVEAAVKSGRNVNLCFATIDEDCREQPIVQAQFKAFTENPPVAPKYNEILGLKRKKIELQKYTEKRDQYLAKIKPHLQEWNETAEKFWSEAMTLQSQTLEKFDQEVKRKGRLYPRSDIQGLLIRTIEFRKEHSFSHLCIYILNTDGKDAVSYRRKRTKPFHEIPDSDILIFSAPKGSPEKEPLFAGISNKVLRSNGLSEALEIAFTYSNN